MNRKPHHDKSICCLLLVLCIAPRCDAAQQTNAAVEDPSNKVAPAAGSVQQSDFERVYLKAKASSDSDALLKTAAEDESAQRNAAACANYLAGISEALLSGNVRVSKPIIDKISALGTKLDEPSKTSLLRSLFQAGDSCRKQSRNLTADYLYAASLQLKEQSGQTDLELVSIITKLAAMRGFESQYGPAEALYKRAIVILESGKVVDEDLLLSSLSSLAALSAQRGLYPEAVAILQRLTARIERSGRPPGIDTGAYFVQYSQVLKRMGKAEESRTRMATVLDIAARFLEAPPVTFDKAHVLSLGNAICESVKPQVTSTRATAFDEQVARALRTGFRLRVMAGDQADENFEDELNDACRYFEKFGKTNDSANLFGVALKSTVHDEEVYRRIRENYLDALKAANRGAEATKIENELDRTDQLRWKEAEASAEQALVRAREKKVDSEDLVKVIGELLKVRLAARKFAAAIPLVREIISIGQHQQDLEIDDATAVLLWDFVRSALVSDERKASDKHDQQELAKEERIIYDVAGLDERCAAQRTELGRITDLSPISRYFLNKERYADAADFMKHVIALRKKYRPKDLVAASQGYELLSDIYRAAGDQEKFHDARKQFLNIMEARYAHSDPRTIRPRLVVVVMKIQEGKLDEAQAIMNQVIATLEGVKQEPSGTQRADVLIQIRRMVGMYLANYYYADADHILKKGMSLSRGIGEPAWLRVYRERIIDHYCQSGEYDKAEELCKLGIAAIAKKSTVPEDLVQAHARLSEVYLFHGNYLQKQEKDSDAKKLFALAQQEFDLAMGMMQKTQDSENGAVAAARRRHEALAGQGALTSVTTARDKFGIDVRHHLPDVLNQVIASPREPLTFAVFGRSEVLLSGRATTWSALSEADPLTILDTGGDIGSYGKIKLMNDCAAHGSLTARNVFMLQNNVNLGDNQVVGNAPRPYPLPAPVALPAGLKAVRPEIKNGVVTRPPAGCVVDLGELILERNAVLTLPPGDYIASRIVLQDHSKLIVGKPEAGSAAVVAAAGAPPPVRAARFFFRDMPATGGRPPVQLQIDTGSSLNATGYPADLQVWYGGNGVVVIKGGSVVHGVIYAPRALLSIGGERTRVFGTVVGDEVRIAGEARVVFDKNLPAPKALGMPRLVIRPLNDLPVMTQEHAGTILVGVDPDDDELNQGDTLMGIGQAAAALDHYVKAATRDPSCVTFNALARCRAALKQLPQALADCNKALSIAPDDPHSYATRGEIYALQNQAAQAQADFKKSLQLLPLPDTFSELLTSAICKLGLGETDQAITLLSEAIYVKPDAGLAYEYRAKAFDKKGQPDLATKDRQKLKEVVIAQQKNADKTHQ